MQKMHNSGSNPLSVIWPNTWPLFYRSITQVLCHFFNIITKIFCPLFLSPLFVLHFVNTVTKMLVHYYITKTSVHLVKKWCGQMTTKSPLFAYFTKSGWTNGQTSQSYNNNNNQKQKWKRLYEEKQRMKSTHQEQNNYITTTRMK